VGARLRAAVEATVLSCRFGSHHTVAPVVDGDDQDRRQACYEAATERFRLRWKTCVVCVSSISAIGRVPNLRPIHQGSRSQR
jgi:hypothetical protein